MDVTPGGIFDGNPFDEPTGGAGGVMDVTPGGVLPGFGVEDDTRTTNPPLVPDASEDDWQDSTSNTPPPGNSTTGTSSDRDTLFGFTYEGDYIEDSTPESALQPPRNLDDVPAILRAMGFRIVETADWEVTNYKSVIMIKELA